MDIEQLIIIKLHMVPQTSAIIINAWHACYLKN